MLLILKNFISIRNMEKFESWRALDNGNFDYITTGWKGKHVHYNCNHSNTEGPVSVDLDKPSTSTSYGNEEKKSGTYFPVDEDKRREKVHGKACLQLKSIDDENFTRSLE